MIRRLSLFLILGLAAVSHADEANPYKTWRQYGGGPDQSKFVDFKQITKENVNKLDVSWFYASHNGNASMFNPIVVDNIMYVLGYENSLVALDATTGKELWVHSNLSGIIKRGINYWESPDRKDRRLIFCMRDTLQEIDATTGKTIRTFGDNGVVSLRDGLGRDPKTIFRVQSTTPGAVFENLIILGSSPGENFMSAPGHLRAYDIVTGELVWTFHTIPQPGEYGYDTWPKDAYKYVGGVNTWGEISVDAKRGIVYFPVGSPTYDYFGADRTGSNLYGSSILALDARTGKRLWDFQTVHHDLWDYDLCAAPQLITVQHDGKAIDAVAAATKQGFLYVFDRVTGEPLWPIEERPVPQSQIPQEHSWPTQPFPTAPPPFNRHNVTEADLNPYFSPEQLVEWKKRLAAAKTGLYQPLSDKYETIAMPGATGGANFGNSAANPAEGIVYVATQEYPSVFKLKKEPAIGAPPAAISPDQVARATAAYTQNCQACHGADHAGIGSFPSLVNLGSRIRFDEFKTIIGVGRGQMPGFPHIDESTITDLYAYLKGDTEADPVRRGGNQKDKETKEAHKFSVPIVESGGALGDQPPEERRRGGGGKKYPEGVTPPDNHYTTGYGLEYPNLLSPPWSKIVAYDLNKGTIKWERPLGQDPTITPKDGVPTGIPNGSQRKGMIVTSTGILFASCKDGKIYAYDVDDGRILWSYQLPRNPEGLMSMYEVNGRQYLAVCSMDFVIDKTKEPPLPPAYIVFALPETDKVSKVSTNQNSSHE